MDSQYESYNGSEAKFYIVYPNRPVGKRNPKSRDDGFIISLGEVVKILESTIGKVPFIITDVTLTDGMIVGDMRTYIDRAVYEFKSIYIPGVYKDENQWARMCLEWAKALINHYEQFSTIVTIDSGTRTYYTLKNSNTELVPATIQYASSSCEAQYTDD